MISRKQMTAAVALAAALAASPLAGGTAAADAAAGKAKAGMCRACHGIDGVAKQPDAPNIGGESAIYLERQLRAFRSGERKHEQMSIIAGGLSDEDIADLVAWYSGIKFSVQVPPG
jgi:cytochrome c553